MTLKFNDLTTKNFMSFGAITQSIKFDKPLTLILGSNLDTGGDAANSRNGAGKSSIINALSYVLYGQALANIRKDALVNLTNGKQMLVTLTFEKNGAQYRIERGRKPNILKFFVNNNLQKSGVGEDDSQGDSRETQKEIEKVLGMSHTMFRHTVALNTYSEPFLSMKATDQREIIEQLLGITLLSEKAEALKVQIKDTKDKISAEQYRIEGVKAANDNVQRSIDNMIGKSRAWEAKKASDIDQLAASIAKLEELDIGAELAAHEAIGEWNQKSSIIVDIEKQLNTHRSILTRASRLLDKSTADRANMKECVCPTCSQSIDIDKHNTLVSLADETIVQAATQVEQAQSDVDSLSVAIIAQGALGKKPITYYRTVSEALGHKSSLDSMNTRLATRVEELNPFEDQIAELRTTAIQPIIWDLANTLSKTKDHQEFLLKLLTNKDSFIRKKIIEQNLAYLNSRLSYYTGKLGLPHKVVFENDLTVTLTQLGQELDFQNLSRGEMNRLTLGLSFAFRDVWENLYDSVNLLFIDEILDTGMDSAGIEDGLALLKKIARERGKNIYWISHKDELISRVDNILRAVKEGGFTTIVNPEESIANP